MWRTLMFGMSHTKSNLSKPYKKEINIYWHYFFQHTRLDDEHVILFNLIQELGENPADVDLLNKNRDHFDYEEKQFMAWGEPGDADAHKKKHNIFFKTLTWVTNPLSQEYAAFAKNWLAQHIKNTDFKYRYKLATQRKTPEPYMWNNEFEVFVSINSKA